LTLAIKQLSQDSLSLTGLGGVVVVVVVDSVRSGMLEQQKLGGLSAKKIMDEAFRVK